MKTRRAWIITTVAVGLVGVTVGIGLSLLWVSSPPDSEVASVVPEQTPVVLEPLEEVAREEATDASTTGEPFDSSDPAWQTIGQYYGELLYDLEKAYAMRADRSVSFKTFQSWYDRVKFAWTRNPVSIGDDTYQFLVNLVEEDPFQLSLYQVVMKVVDGKVETISAREVHEGILGQASRPGYQDDGVQIYYDDGVEYVYRDHNDQRTTIKTIDRRQSSEFGGGDLFVEIQQADFSQSGDYLMVSLSGWESGSVEIYDMGRNSKVHEASTANIYAFASDESWFAECQGSGMASGYVRVYDVPSWSLRYEHPAGESFDSCSIDVERQQIEFLTTAFETQGTMETTVWRYDIVKDEAVRVE